MIDDFDKFKLELERGMPSPSVELTDADRAFLESESGIVSDALLNSVHFKESHEKRSFVKRL